MAKATHFITKGNKRKGISVPYYSIRFLPPHWLSTHAITY